MRAQGRHAHHARAAAGRPQRGQARGARAKSTACARWTTDLDEALADPKIRSTSTPQTTQLRAEAASSAPSRPASTSTARSRSPRRSREALDLYAAAKKARRQARRGAGQALAARAAEAAEAARRRASSAGSSPCAASSATGCSKATRVPGAAAVVELPQGGRRRHHPRHAVPLALRARQPVRRGEGGVLPGRDAHPAALGRERASRTRRRPTTRPTRPSSWKAASSRISTPRGDVRVRRDDLLTLQVDGTQGQRGRRPAATAGFSATRRRRKPVWNPDIPQPINFFDGWQEVPEQTATTTPSRCSGSCSCKHVARRGPFRWDLLEGAKGVQLAELGLKSWKQRKWLDVPRLKA